jgi:excisionase family DNA binding protein
MTTHETRYLTVAEAAERLRVSRPTVWRWIDSGKLPAFRVGARSIRIREEDIDRVVEPLARESSAIRRLQNQPGFWSYQQGDPNVDVDELLERLRRHREEILKAHGGEPFESSVEIIRQAREER